MFNLRVVKHKIIYIIHLFIPIYKYTTISIYIVCFCSSRNQALSILYYSPMFTYHLAPIQSVCAQQQNMIPFYTNYKSICIIVYYIHSVYKIRPEIIFKTDGKCHLSWKFPLQPQPDQAKVCLYLKKNKINKN